MNHISTYWDNLKKGRILSKWSEAKIEILAQAYFEHIDGELRMEGGWDALSAETRAYFVERMRWAVEVAKV